MSGRLQLYCLATTAAALLAAATPARAQESPVRRVANIVTVAVGEYGKGVDDQGRVIAADELQEAIGFLDVARQAATRIPADRFTAARPLLDSIVAAATAHRPHADLVALEQRFTRALGADAALELPSQPLDLAEGRALYQRTCAQCHGTSGLGDGPTAIRLHLKAPPIGTAQVVDSVTADMMFRIASVGIAGTPMTGFADVLTPAQRWNVVAYIRSLPAQDTAARSVSALLAQALADAQQGRTSDAGDRAFDAYLAFEPIEAPARAKNPGLVSTVERLFADFKVAVRNGDIRAAQHARDVIELNLPAVVDLTRPAGSAGEAFWQSFLIILREGFEAILVIGAIVTFLLKTGHRERLRSIWGGVALALLASAATAVILRTVLGAVPASSEIIEGVTLLVAVCVLFSVSYWLISRVEAAKWQQFIREKVTDALQHGGGTALGFVAFLAVYREGAETALFYQALFSEGAHLAVPLGAGIAVGFVALAIIFTLFYRFGVKIPLRPFFTVTSALLYYMAFVFAGKGVRELQEGNAMSMHVVAGVPTIEALGLYPTWETLLAQLLLAALFVFALAATFWPRRSPASPRRVRDAGTSR